MQIELENDNGRRKFRDRRQEERLNMWNKHVCIKNAQKNVTHKKNCHASIQNIGECFCATSNMKMG